MKKIIVHDYFVYGLLAKKVRTRIFIEESYFLLNGKLANTTNYSVYISIILEVGRVLSTKA